MKRQDLWRTFQVSILLHLDQKGVWSFRHLSAHTFNTKIDLLLTFQQKQIIVHIINVLYVCLTTRFCTLKELKVHGFPFCTEPKNCYLWFPMISGHGTENMLSMGFEILELDLVFCKLYPWHCEQALVTKIKEVYFLFHMEHF